MGTGKHSEAQEVKQLREENSRLKKLVADLSLRPEQSASLRCPPTFCSNLSRME